MPNKTNVLELVKPLTTENYNISVQNNNFDKVDLFLSESFTSEDVTYSSGLVQTIVYKQNGVTVKTETLTYTDGLINTNTIIIGSKTIVETYNYTSGNLISITRVVS